MTEFNPELALRRIADAYWSLDINHEDFRVFALQECVKAIPELDPLNEDETAELIHRVNASPYIEASTQPASHDAAHYAELVSGLRMARMALVAAMLSPKMSVEAAEAAAQPIDAILAKNGGAA